MMRLSPARARSGVIAAALLASTAAHAGQPNFQNFVDAYIWGYSLASVEATDSKLTAVPNAQTAPFQAPRNQFSIQTQLVDANFTAIVRPNADTLYANAFLNLSKGPIVLSAPAATHFWIMEMLDAWTNEIADPGTKATGNAAQNYVVIGPNWTGTIPPGLTPIYSTTNDAWVLGRIFVAGPDDLPAALAQEEQYKLIPLADWGLNYIPPANVKVTAPNAEFTSGTPVNVSPGFISPDYFKFVSQYLKRNPPPTDPANIAALANFRAVTHHAAEFSLAVYQAAFQEMAAQKASAATFNDGWLLFLGLGQYGDNFALRGLASYLGLGAPQATDAVYPLATTDSTGAALDCANSYVMHFPAVNGVAQTPPTVGFWSLTVYNAAGLFIANPWNKYNVNSAAPLQYNADGSLDLVVQASPPTTLAAANWVPCGSGTFNMTFRDWGPGNAVTNNTYAWPYVAKQSGPL